jgi:predicted dehydrogenase
MNEIVVVGAGQLGSRHLQGAAELHADARLHMVDPSDSAIEQARVRVAQSAGAEVAAALVAHRDLESLPRRIDAAIIATTADRRFAAVARLLERARVGCLLLEKVLFQKLAEYEAMGDLLARAGTPTWVNCPRRAYPVYRGMRDWFASDALLRLEVTGGGWGLGCNGIHFIDLFAFLSGTAPTSYDTGGLAPGTVPGRRAGYVEFSGTLRAAVGERSLSLTARHDSPLRHLLVLRSASQHVVVDEVGGKLWRWQANGDVEQAEFAIPFQSAMTGQLVRQMLTEGSCPLTPYPESAAMHVPFVAALSGHEGQAGGECRIT